MSFLCFWIQVWCLASFKNIEVESGTSSLSRLYSFWQERCTVGKLIGVIRKQFQWLPCIKCIARLKSWKTCQKKAVPNHFHMKCTWFASVSHQELSMTQNRLYLHYIHNYQPLTSYLSAEQLHGKGAFLPVLIRLPFHYCTLSVNEMTSIVICLFTFGTGCIHFTF